MINQSEKIKPENVLESHCEKMSCLIRDIAGEINKDLQTRELIADNDQLLNEDGRLNMRSFERGKGGPYQRAKAGQNQEQKNRLETSIKEDLQFVKEQKERWGQVDEQKVERTAGAMLEKLVTVIFYKFLKTKFLVVRSAEFDDYLNGVDNMIIDKETGSVICAFDEVSAEKGAERYSEKIKKVVNNAEHGGTYIKYGMTFEKNKNTGDSQLIKKALHYTPTFYLPLSQSELEEVLKNMNYDLSAEPTEIEHQIFNQLLGVLEEQTQMLADNLKVHGQVKNNLEQFSRTVQGMKK